MYVCVFVCVCVCVCERERERTQYLDICTTPFPVLSDWNSDTTSADEKVTGSTHSCLAEGQSPPVPLLDHKSNKDPERICSVSVTVHSTSECK